MNTMAGLSNSTLGKKFLMAASGAFLCLFVLGHMSGNMLLYFGPELLNAYGHKLQNSGVLLWAFRLAMLVAVGVHVIASVQLWLRNRRSRPVKYRVFNPPAVDYAARTMVWSGPIILLFILYHLAHFTVGLVHHDFVRGDVYHNVVSSFQIPWVAGIYIVANVLLAIHLYHGVWSAIQTAGWDHPRWGRYRRWLAVGFAVLIGVGNVSFPVSVLTGLVQ